MALSSLFEDQERLFVTLYAPLLREIDGVMSMDLLPQIITI